MKKQWKQFLYVAAVLCVNTSCLFNDRTTIVFGTVKDNFGVPVAGVDVELYGVKGVFAAQVTPLRTTQTDAKGEYSITIEMPKEYNSGDIDFVFKNNMSFRYSNIKSILYYNKNETKNCCRVEIGQKNQYDLDTFSK